MEAVPLLTLPVHSALTGDHIADVSVRAEDTALQVREAASSSAGLDVNLRLIHENRRVEDSETVAEAGFCDNERVLAIAERRQRQINNMIEVYEKAERLNACFMVDCTGSMGSHISAVKEQIHSIVREMQMRLPNMQLRLSFLGYRDHCDDVRFELLPFTASVEEFQAFVAQIRATGGGGDGPEDVHGAVDMACSLDWTVGDAATRVLIHIADHPAHGRHWNDSPRDQYPDGDPYGLDLPTLMQKLQALDVQYVFGHVTSHTHKMVRVLNEELGGYIDVKDMNDAAKVTETVTASLHSSVATTVSTLSSKEKPRKLDPEEMSSEIPDWSCVDIHSVRVRTCLLVKDISQLRSGANPAATQTFVETHSAVQLASVPFSQGESRLAKHALWNGDAAVAKQFKQKTHYEDSEDDEDAAADERDAMLILSEVSAVAAFLADCFRQQHPGSETIKFLESLAVDGKGIEPFNLELALPVADFVRYSNNIGWWEADAPETLLRFTRWTHEITGGHVMVADLQGVKTDEGWLLTDPCILCEDTSRFGSGNLGPYAMERCCKAIACLLDPPALPSHLPKVSAPPNAWKFTGKHPDGSVDGPLDVDSLISSYMKTQVVKGKPYQASEAEIRQLLGAARDTFLRQPSLLELDAPIKVMGDIHGQFSDLLQMFERNGAPPASNYLMLGDYVDRGKHSVETITLLLALKVKYPEHFFLLRGNHECASITRIYGFYDECKRKYNIKLWKRYCDVFNCLPPAALIEQKIFCMHGGISPSLSSFDDVRNMVRPTDVPDTGLLCDLLWADPDPSISGWSENDRGVSFTYGADALTNFHQRFGTDLIVRAHQVVEDGYEFFAGRQLVTLFSAPNYCGEFDNAGGLLSISDDLMCSFEVLRYDREEERKKNRVVA